MTPTLLTLALAAALSADADPPRKPNPLAPSLPLLTDEEEERLDAIINRFIEADTGQTPGPEYARALRDLEKLGPEAIPALVRGLNRAAGVAYSCPTATIAAKLRKMLMASDDRELLQFARENIGSGMGRTAHAAILQNLRVDCMVRKAELVRQGKTTASLTTKEASRTARPGDRALRSMSLDDLAKLAGSERGPRLKEVLVEIETRRGDVAIAALGSAAASYEPDVRDLARGLLEKNLVRQGTSVIKEKTKDDRAEVRAATARVIAGKAPKLGGELIDLLDDDNAGVRQAAHDALVKLARGADYGPAKTATREERAEAVKKWHAWWDKQEKR
jgi:hypothetical protein